jgi:phage replication-related protein YjqB (UPF0714/DUF867 family)
LKKKILIGLVTFLMITILTVPALADTYSSYNSLKAHETINTDYKIVSRDTASSTAVIAIHGGTIERQTDKIASAVATQGKYDYYGFVGLRSGGWSLHITSTNFDEPIGRRLVAKSNKTLAIHGCGGTSQSITYVGGLDTTLGKKVKSSLQAAGFNVASAPSSLAGRARTNICNSNSINKGVQLELSSPMRTKLANNSNTFNLYATTLANAIK